MFTGPNRFINQAGVTDGAANCTAGNTRSHCSRFPVAILRIEGSTVSKASLFRPTETGAVPSRQGEDC